MLDFDSATNEFAQWLVAMPSNWNASTVTAQFYWTAASGSGDVIWGCQGYAYGDSDAIDAAMSAGVEVTDTLITALDVHISSATGAITLDGTPAAGELVVFQVYRHADDGNDTLNAVDARLLAVKIVYGIT